MCNCHAKHLCKSTIQIIFNYFQIKSYKVVKNIQIPRPLEDFEMLPKTNVLIVVFILLIDFR